ncbi:hypothetical protein FXO38_07175 [Capsicum annuum]|uniref:Protein kinase domain-containing protein n=1 Tax=Capsicum annuum TaxID=4072 RepID=A0A2G2ZNC2_CAPAN|nr:hypothetical protein FXO38_07175 [Capsicum annuum]PHT83473.1 hypothetical protein T459_11916 [Capsicum annuum]
MNIMEQKTGELVTIDGERKLELETLLKTSAYILGANGSNIMYKAVLEDGTTLLVRRISESVMERFKDFENQVKIIAKLVNPNLINIRGFYWGTEEKLVIYDFVPNGSLADAHYSKSSFPIQQSPYMLFVVISLLNNYLSSALQLNLTVSDSPGLLISEELSEFFYCD